MRMAERHKTVAGTDMVTIYIYIYIYIDYFHVHKLDKAVADTHTPHATRHTPHILKSKAHILKRIVRSDVT